ncbi:MAG: putative RNA methyltransferase [Methanosaeta sp. PtaU1.Bin112]|nr:MAG: putative RNA methyltransferase [Methanosaeta sp. PtaU1.Bin112]
MKNFGFSEMVLVNACKIEDFGLAMASHAGDVLMMARRCAGLDEALDGADLVVGTTGKRLDLAQHHLRLHLRVPCLTPKQLAKKLAGKEGTVALLLGREDCGLNSEELALCDMLVSIPTSSDYPVMNLSHSAAVLFYELAQIESEHADGCKVEMASGETQALLREKSVQLLRETDYPPHKVDFTLIMLRRILGRAELTQREARTLLGLIKRILWKIVSEREKNEGSGPECD